MEPDIDLGWLCPLVWDIALDHDPVLGFPRRPNVVASPVPNPYGYMRGACIGQKPGPPGPVEPPVVLALFFVDRRLIRLGGSLYSGVGRELLDLSTVPSILHTLQIGRAHV